MDDLISRQAAIDEIEAHWDTIKGFHPTLDDATAMYVDHKIIIKNLPSVQPEQRWIPVTERLPEKDGDYLVCYEEGYRQDYGIDEIGIAPFEVYTEGFGIWQESFDVHTLGSLGSDWVDIPVTAWQPLPEPYRKEESV